MPSTCCEAPHAFIQNACRIRAVWTVDALGSIDLHNTVEFLTSLTDSIE